MLEKKDSIKTLVGVHAQASYFNIVNPFELTGILLNIISRCCSPNKALAEEGFLLGFYRSTFAHQVFGPSPVVAGRRRLLA